jgi:hypothetical protein
MHQAADRISSNRCWCGCAAAVAIADQDGLVSRLDPPSEILFERTYQRLALRGRTRVARLERRARRGADSESPDGDGHRPVAHGLAAFRADARAESSGGRPARPLGPAGPRM